MVYLDNKKDPQEVWIPRNEGQGTPHKPSTKLEIGEITVTADTQTNYPSSGYIGFSSVVIDSSEYAQHNYDLGYSEGENDGYISGVTDGEQSVIDTFTSTTITENGQYGSSANPYSSVTVNVAQTGHTDQELQDAYSSGYTSGETHQKSLLTSTAFTENGSYSRENGYSAITVNVPQTGSTAVLGVGSFSANGTYSASTDNLDGYSAITINVPTSGGSVKYIEYIETNGTQIGWDTSYNIGTDIDAKIYLDFMPISGNGYGDYWFAYYGDCAENVLFRRAGNYASIGFMFGNNSTHKDYSNYSVVNGNRYLISLDKNGITDENTGTLLVAASSSSINSTKNLYLNCEGLSGNNQVYRCIRARYYSFRVENGNGETTLDMRPCLDGNNVPCFYDEVSHTYIYHIGNGTPIAGPISDPSYESGFTDGIAYQKSLLGTTAFTSNGSFSAENGYSAITVNVPQQSGVYGSKTINVNGTYSASTDNLDGFSSVTVNVPQSGGSGYSIDQLAIRDYNINNPTVSTTDIKLFAFANSNLSGMLTIGSAVTNIYAYAFSYTNISGITFPQTIVGNEYGKMVMVGYGQFEGCGNLTSVNIPSYIEFTDNARARNTYGIFEECRNLVSVNWDADRVPTYCFRYCSSLSAINLTNVTNIDDYSFMNCGSLSSITIPSVCTRIGNGAFGNCRSLNEINVLATTAPTLGVVAFTNTSTGTVHYPQGSDYSSWQNDSNLSGWTFIADL